MATSVVLSPSPILQFFDNNGVELANGFLSTTVGGVPYPTYSEQTGTVQLPNPIPLNSRGEISTAAGQTSPLFVVANTVYQFTLLDQNNNVIWSQPYVNGTQYVLTDAEIAAVISQNTVGGALYPPNGNEIASGITLNTIYEYGDIRRYGVVANCTDTSGKTGTSQDALINAALAFGATYNQAIEAPGGANAYGFQNMIIPGGCVLRGDGVGKTNFIAITGATGAMVADNGSSAKTIVEGVSFFGNGPSSGNCTNYTSGLKMGYGASPFGTEGYLNQIQIRDLPSSATGGFPGFDVNANVGEFGNIYCLNTGGLQILGTGNTALQIESTSSQGWLLSSGQIACVNLQDCQVSSMEVEAPGAYITGGSTLFGGTNTPNFTGSSTVMLLLGGGPGSPGGNCAIGSLYLSLSANLSSPAITYTYDHAIELAAGAGTWDIKNLKIYYQSVTGTDYATITKGLFKDSNGLYFGAGNPLATAGLHTGEGNYTSGAFNAGTIAAIARQQMQAFTVELTASSSVIEHRIGAVGGVTTAGNFLGQIVGASTSYVNTPTGTDTTTNFANGAKIGSASPSVLWLNIANPQIAANLLAWTRITLNNSGSPYEVQPIMTSLTINHVTQVFFGIQLMDPTTNAAVSWSTALSTSNSIIVTVLAFLA